MKNIIFIVIALLLTVNIFAGNITATGMFQGDLYTLLSNVVTMANANKSLANSSRNSVNGDFLITTPALGVGSTATDVASIAFDFTVNGMGYKKAAVAAGTAPGTDVIPQSKYGCVAFQIGADGTIDAVSATGNATGYASEALAIAGLPAVAADHARLGYVTVIKSDGAFTFGTTELSAANVTDAYYLGSTIFNAQGSANATTDLTLSDL